MVIPAESFSSEERRSPQCQPACASSSKTWHEAPLQSVTGSRRFQNCKLICRDGGAASFLVEHGLAKLAFLAAAKSEMKS